MRLPASKSILGLLLCAQANALWAPLNRRGMEAQQSLLLAPNDDSSGTLFNYQSDSEADMASDSPPEITGARFRNVRRANPSSSSSRSTSSSSSSSTDTFTIPSNPGFIGVPIRSTGSSSSTTLPASTPAATSPSAAASTSSSTTKSTQTDNDAANNAKAAAAVSAVAIDAGKAITSVAIAANAVVTSAAAAISAALRPVNASIPILTDESLGVTNTAPTVAGTSPSSKAKYDPTTCLIEYNNWCGTLQTFTDSKSCTAAVQNCYTQFGECPNVSSSGSKPCGLYRGVCTQLETFCANCGTNCDRSFFGFKIGNQKFRI